MYVKNRKKIPVFCKLRLQTIKQNYFYKIASKNLNSFNKYYFERAYNFQRVVEIFFIFFQ